MTLKPTAAVLAPPVDPWEQVDRIERSIRNEFSHRVHNFHIQAFDDGLVLEGRTKTFYGKQMLLKAVMDATSLPILADRIVVG